MFFLITENDWKPEDGEALWDRCEEKLVFAKVNKRKKRKRKK